MGSFRRPGPARWSTCDVCTEHFQTFLKIFPHEERPFIPLQDEPLLPEAHCAGLHDPALSTAALPSPRLPGLRVLTFCPPPSRPPVRPRALAPDEGPRVKTPGPGETSHDLWSGCSGIHGVNLLLGEERLFTKSCGALGIWAPWQTGGPDRCLPFCPPVTEAAVSRTMFI